MLKKHEKNARTSNENAGYESLKVSMYSDKGFLKPEGNSPHSHSSMGPDAYGLKRSSILE